MGRKTRVDVLILYILIWSSTSTVSSGTETDFYCLKSIKDSLEDPHGYLSSSWNFHNYTEGFICSFAGVECWHPDENKVLNLRLSGMGLKGQFPRGIGNCTSLTGLDLSNNEFHGSIPFDIANLLAFITSLDLSSNHFSGEIPSSIANCFLLNILKLDSNHLTGHIPQQIAELRRLKTFSVANNQLSGPVPEFEDARLSAESYENNIDLCGGPLELCTDDGNKFLSKFRSGFAIGYAISAVPVFVLCMSYFVPWLSSGKRNSTMTIAAMIKWMIKRRKKQTQLDRVVSLPAAEIRQQNEMYVLEQMVTRFQYADLRKATSNFSEANIIGRGKMGIMYKARLPDGQFLAVKLLHESYSFGEQFISEFKTLGTLSHMNLLPLLGF